jgi:hypothetical protein
MIEFIAKDYETLKQKTIYAAWSALKLTCDRRQITAPSYKTSRSPSIGAPGLNRH